ncbi:hypothetical protein HYC85_029445 [Camellia sinensis]|uniref:Uncharacterized protein n=1 Tax=Camellia sinensis TaxID=4442 RepID=A0A7J7G1X8_CAMSI|nr:hypothetical protein HYC85_029445 [Camellia sinensis]
MDILRAKHAARAIEGETRTSFLKKEFYRSNLAEFSGGPDPMKADEWLEQNPNLLRSWTSVKVSYG